jgi:hypothetical protein
MSISLLSYPFGHFTANKHFTVSWIQIITFSNGTGGSQTLCLNYKDGNSNPKSTMCNLNSWDELEESSWNKDGDSTYLTVWL